VDNACFYRTIVQYLLNIENPFGENEAQARAAALLKWRTSSKKVQAKNPRPSFDTHRPINILRCYRKVHERGEDVFKVYFKQNLSESNIISAPQRWFETTGHTSVDLLPGFKQGTTLTMKSMKEYVATMSAASGGSAVLGAKACGHKDSKSHMKYVKSVGSIKGAAVFLGTFGPGALASLQQGFEPSNASSASSVSARLDALETDNRNHAEYTLRNEALLEELWHINDVAEAQHKMKLRTAHVNADGSAGEDFAGVDRVAALEEQYKSIQDKQGEILALLRKKA
jgi:hypothetical protein